MEITVPADFSSAAFFIVAATIVPHSELLIRSVGVNPTRSAMLDIMKLMGANITLINKQVISGEPVADVCIKHANLKGIDIPEELVPIAIDELPVLLIAAGSAKGTTRLTGAAELRVKESDRLHAMTVGFHNLGIQAETNEDGMTVTGGEYQGGVVDSFGDHRIAMAFAIAGAISRQSIKILHCRNVATSFPNFIDTAKKAGISVEQGNR